MCQIPGKEPKDTHVLHELIHRVSINMLHVLCYMGYRIQKKNIVDENYKLNPSCLYKRTKRTNVK